MLQTVRRIITENVLLLSRRYRLEAAAVDSVVAGHGGAGEIRRCTTTLRRGGGRGLFARVLQTHTRDGRRSESDTLACRCRRPTEYRRWPVAVAESVLLAGVRVACASADYDERGCCRRRILIPFKRFRG